MDRTLKCDHCIFSFQFYPVSKFQQFINFELGTVNSERVTPGHPQNFTPELTVSLFLITSLSILEETCHELEQLLKMPSDITALGKSLKTVYIICAWA